MKTYFYHLSTFFFPDYCPVCGLPMHSRGMNVCLPCEHKMPKTNYAREAENPVAQLFWGRVYIEAACSYMRFEKGSRYQQLLHQLKYKGNRRMGRYLGSLLGVDLLESTYHTTDYVIPVPLHPSRERKRGYNQSVLIAEGLSLILQIPILDNLIYRVLNTESQTNKNRFDRSQNMEGVFALRSDSQEYSGKKLLLVDDVITTGSTIEACALELQKIDNVKLYISSVACA